MQRGFVFIVLPLLFLTLSGLIFNNLSNGNAYQNNPLQTTCNGFSCPMYPNNNPCQTQSNCQLSSSSSISFLNAQSPFTFLIQGNILGFIGSLTSTNNNSPNGYFALDYCKSYQGSGSSITAFYCLGESGYGCTLFPPFNATSTTGNNSAWSIIGYQFRANNCNFEQTPIVQANGVIYGYYTVLNATFDTLNVIQQTNSPSATFINTFSVLGVIIGIILFLLAMGIGFNAQALATGLGITVDSQGTRLAQILAIGLISFSFLFSEFGSWIITSGFNLGIDIMIPVILAGSFFFGIYDMVGTTSGTTE